MKIAHCIYSFKMGGAETLLIDLINRQVKQHDIFLLIINDRINKELISQIDPRAKVIQLKRTPKSRNPWFIIKLNWLLWVKIKPNVLHLHSYTLPAIIFYPRKRLFATIHDVNIPTIYHKRYHRLFAISRAVYDDITSRVSLPPNTIILAPNGIDCNKIKIREIKKTSPVYNIKIIQVSRFEAEKKGQDLLIEAVRMLKIKNSLQAQITFIGDGPSLPEIKELVNKYGLEEQVIFLGEKTREFIYSHLKDFDLLVQPSRFEGFGLTVAEAMAAKIPVLVSNVYGPMEIINNGEFGFYFENDNAIDLSKKIKLIAKSYRKAEELASKAIKHVYDTYDINILVHKYEEAYYEN